MDEKIEERIIDSRQYNLPVKKSLLALTACLYVLMFAYALSFTIIGPLIPIFLKQYNISFSQGGLITLYQGIGGVISISLGVMFADIFRRSVLIKTAFGVYCVSVILVALLPSYTVLLILFFLIGASTRMVDTILNVYIANIHPNRRGFFLNLLHACFGVGALLGPVLSTAFLNAGVQWNIIFFVLGCFCIMILFAYTLIQNRIQEEKEKHAIFKIGMIINFLKNKNILLLSILCFLYVGFVSASSTWMPTYFTQQLNIQTAFISLPVSALWIGVIVGRLVYSVLSLKHKIKNLILYSNLLAGIIMLMATFINSMVFL